MRKKCETKEIDGAQFKKCLDCDDFLPIEEFLYYKSDKTRSRCHKHHKEHQSKLVKNWRKNNHDKKVEEYLKNNPVKHIIQFSGGVNSFATAKNVVDRYGNKDVILLFADTKIEDEDLYIFLEQTSKFLDAKLIRLEDGRDPWELFKQNKIIPGHNRAPCSITLKREMCRRWIKKNFAPHECIIYLGFDWMEQHRHHLAFEKWTPYKAESPLIEDLSYDKDKFMAKFHDWGINIPRLYKMGFSHNNCGGFCVKAGKAHFLNLYRNMPERFMLHAQKEKELQEYLGKSFTILKENKDKTKRYISLYELAERADEIAETEEGKFEFGACGCFSDYEEKDSDANEV